MVNSYEHGMGNCDIGAFTSSMGTDPHKLCMKIGVFILHGCMRTGDQSGSQQGIPFPGFAGFSFFGTFVIPGT